MPLHLHKRLFPGATREQLLVRKNKDIQLKTYDRMIIMKLDICKVKIEHSNKQKMCKFFVVSGNMQALLVMPDIDTEHYIYKQQLSRKQETDRSNNCSTNTAICQDSRPEHHHTNMMEEAYRVKKCSANTDSISEFDNKDNPMVIDTNITQ